MSVEVRVDLSDVSAKLNTASSLITKYYADIEAVLKQANLGVETWVRLDAARDLGYTRCAGVWQLVVRTVGFDHLPLHNESRHTKLLAIKWELRT
jgi:hypothetical protein